ncbi:MAG TPA: pantoate--beta-alanine ligase [Gammaproteobacteria bacterium]|jgi:pantoate--beta-alanine ligase|nr:pantoate--beta-alanine ligase [Gammaproteobacteria bacterium]
MNIVTEISDYKKLLAGWQGKSIGFIPTMGHLHEGHMTLCEASTSQNDITVVSIFVNPTQFNQASDFEHYPRTLAEDQALLASAGVDVLFLPDQALLYPDAYQVKIVETIESTLLEGMYRLGHFEGMLTVVLKLLNIITPHRVYFGEKDYQQLLLVKKMLSALFLQIDIVPIATKRAPDGLALSSRNSRLTKAQRAHAAHFPRLLGSDLSCDEIQRALIALDFRVDYIVEQWGRRLGAVWLGEVRLIDNVLKG